MIVICGCSWAVGEWDDSGGLSGPGLAQYLSFKTGVTNLAQPGASNLQQVRALREFLTRYTPGPDDVCYWVVTELVRDIEHIGADPIDTIKSTLHEFLSQANDLAQKIQIHLIGGLCDLTDVDITKYSRLRVAVPSWCRLCDPRYPASIYNDIDYDLAVQAVTPQQKSQVEFISQQGQLKTQAFNTLLHFQASHPDRLAHLHLRNYLRPEWSTIN